MDLHMRGLFLAAVVASVAISTSVPAARAATINVVAAENFWAEPVRAIGGANVAVTEVMSSPNADPHDYEPTPSVAKAVADADIVIYNGADYDSWMEKLVAASKAPKRTVISVATLLHRKAGD